MRNAPEELLDYLRRLTTPAALASLRDDVLLRRFVRERDEVAFAVLVHRHGPMVLAACRRSLSQAQDVEDVFQATFVVLSRRAGQLAQPERVAPWLYGVAIRLARKVRERSISSALPDDWPAREAPEVGESVIDEELAHLPARYREPLVLCCLEGLSREEAAAQLGTTPGAVKGLLERGREQLRQRLERRGVRPELPVGLPVAVVSGELVLRTLEGAANGAVPSAVVELVNGVVSQMTLSRWKMVLSLALVALACSGVALTMQSSPKGEKPKPAARADEKKPEKKVDKPADPAVGVPEDRIMPGDYLFIKVRDALPGAPIDGTFRVEPNGRVPLGPGYGRVDVAGQEFARAEHAVAEHLRRWIKAPAVLVTYGTAPPMDRNEAAVLKQSLDSLEAEVRALRKAVEDLTKKIK